MVKFDADSIASYDGSLDGLAATSPEVTGKSLAANKAAVRAYTAHLDRLLQGHPGPDRQDRPVGHARRPRS